MTNYLILLAAALVSTGAVVAAQSPAAQSPPAKPAPASSAGTHFTQAPGAGNLTFSFMQAGAENQGSFRKFSTTLVYDEKNPASGSLEVTVNTTSLDTQDKDRNDTLASAELLDTAKYPTARYVANQLAQVA